MKSREQQKTKMMENRGKTLQVEDQSKWSNFQIIGAPESSGKTNQPTNQRSPHIVQGNFPELKYVSDWKESSKYSAQLMRIV